MYKGEKLTSGMTQSLTTPCPKHHIGKENDKDGIQNKTRQVKSKRSVFPADSHWASVNEVKHDKLEMAVSKAY